ncbi:hypothetical protein L248_0588 [Schleiferilactobacillus shenzhenensis LY-73]|uniref:Uncharacterized protein n=1 Tax=Schleiferilactobacillus shenzhenensis LY-73 TaxID=1231336 RepID=U4TJ43_9LACO|nr:hypothetical protein L248_0588 [Schleiferilactobacillus shenzhenensis LY-73]
MDGYFLLSILSINVTMRVMSETTNEPNPIITSNVSWKDTNWLTLSRKTVVEQ